MIAVKLCTTPLSLSEASFALCHIGLTRAAMYGASFALDRSDGSWPSSFCGREDLYCAELAKRAGVDFIAPPAHLNDAAAIDADPVVWLNAKLGKIKELLDEPELT